MTDRNQRRRFRSSTDESMGVKLLLGTLAFGYIAVFLLTPLLAVFVEAFRNGVDAYIAAITEKDAQSAIWLTLTVAAIAA